MGIVDEDVARVKVATDFAAVVGEQVALRRVGNRLVGLCPFHSEKTGSFYVNAAEGFYHCFGCQASGDAITFVRETQHLDFVGAVEWLANRAGVTLRYDDARPDRDHRRQSELHEAMQRAVDWYHERLLTSPDAAAARRYLRSDRGYDGETVRAFRLGWAPDDWDALCRSLDLPAGILTDTGLGFVNRAGRRQDTFRNRLMFPIFDAGGRPVAFGGRVLPGGDGPKYKNSPDSAIYHKRQVLYGLNWAKEDVVRAGEVVVCEGYTDVIGLFAAGVPRAVATCGTALADEHFQTLKNFARRVVLAYDADAAGQGAADRFYEWERRFDLDIAVVSLPPGSDPGELAQRDPEALRAAVSDAMPFLAFRLERILGNVDLRTAESRAHAAEAALEVVAEHPSDLVRDQYVMVIGDRCRLDHDALRTRLADLRRRPPRAATGTRRGSIPARGTAAPRAGDGGRSDAGRAQSSASSPAVAVADRGASPMSQPVRSDLDDDGDPGPAPPPDLDPGWSRRRRDVAEPSVGGAAGRESPELSALRLAVHDPESVAALLDEVLFETPLHAAAYHVLVESDTLQDAVAGASDDVAALLRRLSVEEEDADPGDVVALLVRLATLRALRRLEADARASQSVVDTTWVRERMAELTEEPTRVRAAGELVAWLVRSAEEGA